MNRSRWQFPLTIARVARLLAPYRGTVVASLCAMTLAACGFLALPLLARDMLGSAIRGKESAGMMLSGWLAAGAFLVLAASAYLSSLLLFRVANDLTAALRRRFVDGLLAAPLAYHRDTPAGSLIERMSASIADIEGFVRHSLSSLLGVVILMAGGSVMLVVINWQLALLSALAVPVVGLALRWIEFRARAIHRARREESEVLAGSLQGALDGIETVKAFRGERLEQARFEAHLGDLLEVQRREAAVSSLVEPLLVTCAALTFIAVLYFGSHLIATDRLAAEELITFLIYLVFVVPNARNLAFQITRWRHLDLALDRLDVDASVPKETDVPGARQLALPVRGDLAFEGVHFAYAGRGEVLDGISFRVQAGEAVGIAGPSGAGKSTLFHLILRFADPSAGHIVIDGQPLDRITRESVRGAIALVPQDAVLFDDSLLENLRYGRPEAGIDEVRAACAAARIADFIASLPDGFATRPGARGLKLSGGQRQRIAIARAIVRNAPVLLMDEATSSVDPVTERELQAAMQAVMNGRTTLVIAHRLSTLAALPRVLFLADGRLAGDGSHEELLQRSAAYRSFVSTQLAGPGAPS